MKDFSEKQAYRQWLASWGIHQLIRLFMLWNLARMLALYMKGIQTKILPFVSGEVHWLGHTSTFSGIEVSGAISFVLSLIFFSCCIDCLVGLLRQKCVRMFRFWALFLLFSNLVLGLGVGALVGDNATYLSYFESESTLLGVFGGLIALCLIDRYRSLEELKLANDLWKILQETNHSKTVEGYFGLRSVETKRYVTGYEIGTKKCHNRRTASFSVGKCGWLSFKAMLPDDEPQKEEENEDDVLGK